MRARGTPVALSREEATTTARVPARAGVGFKPPHFEDILETGREIGFFEIHAENYMGAGGPPHARLERLRRDHALSIHGVGLSLAGREPLDKEHLGRFKNLVQHYEPGLVSEHLAWSGHNGAFLNDLLPFPYTADTLQNIASHVAQVQEALRTRILIEMGIPFTDLSLRDRLDLLIFR